MFSKIPGRLILLILLSMSSPQARSQLPFEGPCAFYRVKFHQLGCHGDNYLSEFGYRYCMAYLNLEPIFTRKSRVTLAGIRQCLVDTLEQRTDLTCDNVKSIALQSHVPCYRNSDFCALPISEKLKILWVVRKTTMKSDHRKIMEQIMNECFERSFISVSKSP
jgi:hypothetical protein